MNTKTELKPLISQLEPQGLVFMLSTAEGKAFNINLTSSTTLKPRRILKTRKRDFSSLTATHFLFTGDPLVLPKVTEVGELPQPHTLTHQETAPPAGTADLPAVANADDNCRGGSSGRGDRGGTPTGIPLSRHKT